MTSKVNERNQWFITSKYKYISIKQDLLQISEYVLHKTTALY